MFALLCCWDTDHFSHNTWDRTRKWIKRTWADIHSVLLQYHCFMCYTNLTVFLLVWDKCGFLDSKHLDGNLLFITLPHCHLSQSRVQTSRAVIEMIRSSPMVGFIQQWLSLPSSFIGVIKINYNNALYISLVVNEWTQCFMSHVCSRYCLM